MMFFPVVAWSGLFWQMSGGAESGDVVLAAAQPAQADVRRRAIG